MKSGLKLELTQIFDAPIEKVWDAWVNPNNMKQWFSPEGMTTREATVDLEVGGSWRVLMEGANMPDPKHNGVMAVGGEFVEIQKPDKLSCTWLWEGAPKETHTTQVSISLKKISEDKTQVTLVHSGFPDENMQQEHNMGWDSTLRKLDRFIKK